MGGNVVVPSRNMSVVTNLRCNQNCTYCTRRSERDNLAAISGRAVEARIDAGLRAGARELRLTGGEPTLRTDLEALIAHARRGGAERIAVETNATLIDDARARALRAAGLDLARINLVGADERADQVTRDPGGFARALDGAVALTRAGVELEVLCALTRSTRPLVTAMPARLARALPSLALVRAIEATVPIDSPDPAELLSYEEAAETLAALDAAARAASVPLRLADDSGPPPCALPSSARLSHLYSFTPGSPRRAAHTQLAACAECLLADRCSGLPDAYLARRAPPPMQPVREERARRRLSLLSTVPEQIARELVSRSLSGDGEGGAVYDEIIRVNFHCNQACTFCFVSTHLPPATDAAVEDAIRDAGRRGARIVLSGGEPTLNPRLADYVRLAKSVSLHAVILQTNAVRLDDAALCDALIAAGIDEAFVSLHGTTADVSDAVTCAPGTFARTLVGLDNLARTSALVIINFVVCELNRHQFPDLIRLAASRWPRAQVNLSFVAASTDLVPRDRRLIPRYSDARPAIDAGAAEAARLGVRLLGFESMCGLPLCLVPDAVDKRKLILTEIPPGFDRGEFVKTDECRACRMDAVCYGLRRGYAELHGASELRALT
jgi:molybdenum cofactor biosynthesis enzyme MoaA